MNQKEQAARILIIDDEPYIQEIIKRGLNSLGHIFETAGHYREALEKLKMNPFDLALCDIKIPYGDGTSLLRHIRTYYPDTFIIMLTAVDDIHMAIECLRAGANNYLIKPIDLTMLGFSIKEALEKRRLILENKEYRLSLEKKVAQQTEFLRQNFLDTIKTVANCLEAKDAYTRGHSQRVTDHAKKLALAVSLPLSFVKNIHLSGLFHDIGKLGIPEVILNKPGNLTAEEYRQIIQHPAASVKILRPVIHDEEIIKNILHHHERYDGKGYPDGLTGENIPLGARILSIADAFDAMTSDRPYRKVMGKEQAVSELEQNIRTQFDPELVSNFIKIILAGQE